jgi:hypothetical protein
VSLGAQAAAKRYLERARRLRGAAATAGQFEVRQGPCVYAPRPGTLELNDAIVLAGEWFVVAGSQILADAYVQVPEPPLSSYLVPFAAGSSTAEIVFERPTELDAPHATLLGGCANYCHWLLDYLPRLSLAQPAGAPFLVNRPLAGFQRDALAYLGVEERALIALDYPGAYRVRRLSYPSLRSSVTLPPLDFDPAIVAWLRDAFAPLRAAGGRRRLFISRAGESDVHRRRLTNHDEIEAVAVRHGFEPVRLEDLGFLDQVRLFAGAERIAAPHGAGLANLVFAPPGTGVVELMGPRFAAAGGKIAATYQQLAPLLDLGFTRVVGAAPADGAIVDDHLPNETYRIDPDAFAAALG